MSRLRQLFLAVLAASVILLNSCAGGNAGETMKDRSEPEAVSGAPAEEGPSVEPVAFEGTDLAGNAVTADIFSQSRLTMVNVWATYCGPCLREMPDLGRLAAEYDTADFQIIGIVVDVWEDMDKSLAEQLIQQTEANYTHLLMNDALSSSLLKDVTAVPTTFFFDENGVLLDAVIGAQSKSAWEESINGLLEAL